MTRSESTAQVISFKLRQLQLRPYHLRPLLLFVVASAVVYLAGCNSKNMDSDRPSSDYYQGADFHSKQTKH